MSDFLDNSERDFSNLEQKAKDTARNIDTAFKGISLGIKFKEADVAIKSLSLGLQAVKGNLAGVTDAAEGMPLGIGKAVRAAHELYDIVNNTAAKELIKEESLKRQVDLYNKIAEATIKTRDDLRQKANDSERLGLETSLAKSGVFGGSGAQSALIALKEKQDQRLLQQQLTDKDSEINNATASRKSAQIIANNADYNAREELSKWRGKQDILESSADTLHISKDSDSFKKLSNIVNDPTKMYETADAALQSKIKLEEATKNEKNLVESRSLINQNIGGDTKLQMLKLKEQDRLDSESILDERSSQQRRLRSSLISSQGDFSNSFVNRYNIMKLDTAGALEDNSINIDKNIRKLSQMIQTPEVKSLIKIAEQDRGRNADIIGETFRGNRNQLVREAKNQLSDLNSQYADKRPATQNELRFGLMINTNDIPKQTLDEIKDLNRFLKAMVP